MTTGMHRADPLVWGHGPTTFEVFLEPTCPFSVRALGKLDELLEQGGAGPVTVKIRLHSQPWHMYSGVIVRAVLAASTLTGGKEDAKAALVAIGGTARSSSSKSTAAGRTWTRRRTRSLRALRPTAGFRWQLRLQTRRCRRR